MRPFLILLAALGVALVAGCLDRDDASTGGNGDNGTNESTNATTSVPMSFQAAGPGPLGPAGQPFEVTSNATAVLIEARWECTSPTCDITLTVLDENGTEVTQASGNGEANLDIRDPIPGNYTIEFSSNAPVAGVSGEARVTVFTGDVPNGFTAWEEDEAATARRS